MKDQELNQGARAIVANEDLFANLLNDEEQKAIGLDWVFKNVHESMQKLITKEKVKTATLLALEKIAPVIDRIEFINTKSEILVEGLLNNQGKDIVNKFNDLSFSD
ncbi:hypothetical protein A1C_01425 [Rickettsia akari str. Hartford]|uniref:Uncharacterized protein n=1 Tax=Rickettsia akari (strain Hartford) TaxID=293614 RepID=A8GMH8_RICAH|nr:hypothetical protein [Rickettsia akari]ABV74603.1 hypothetical protein A1C_01425 [Rickettsia akari str. Hartford]